MSFGTNTYIDSLLADYVPPGERDTLLEQLLEDETNALLYAVLLELQTLRRAEVAGDADIRTILQQRDDDDPDETGTYRSETVSPGSNWEKIELDFVTSEVDLRFDADIQVAFAERSDDDNVVSYASGDSPVAGIPVRTSEIHVKGDGTSPTIDVDAWGDS